MKPRSASLVCTQNCPALDVQQTISSVFTPLLYGIWQMTKITFDFAVIAPLVQRVTVNAGLLAPTRQSAAGVLSIVSRVFLTLSGEFHSCYYYYYCSHFYDSPLISLFLLAQGCCNDIKKPACLLSCDQYSPNTGLAGVSCGTKTYC